VTAAETSGRRIRTTRFRRPSFRRSRHGVSDVIATILLLALCVTLFASVFFFVNTFPRPPTQPSNQFSATLTYKGSAITSVNVLHLAGPTIAGTSLTQTSVYLLSAAQPHVFAAPFTLASGLNGSTVWSLGQTWSENITSYGLTVPDNITISIISNSQLLFRITLPGSNPTTPPIFSQAGTNPTSPGVSQTFTVFVAITDSLLNTNSVFVNVSQVPGTSGSGLHQMSYLASSGLWIYSVAGGSSSAGTFYVYVNATDTSAAHLQNSIAIPVVVTNSGGAGSILTVSVTANNTAPVSGRPVQLEATATNTGGSAATVVVQFFVGGNPLGSPSSQGLGAGGSGVYTQAWTPASVGTTPIQALATMTGASAESGFSITVYPRILLIAHAYPAASYPVANTSADLAQALTSDGFPFTEMSVACGSTLPTAATMGAYGVVIIDFGSATGLACANVPPGASEQAKITGAATTTNFWLVGSNAFTATACTSYSAAFQTQFGLATSGTCTASHSATTTLTYTASATSPAIRSNGMPSPLSLNQTFQGSATFQPYYSLTTQASGKVWLADSGATKIGVYTNTTTDHQQVILATDPALFSSKTPDGNTYGTATGADSSVVYNVGNFLCGLSTPANPGRGLPDFGLSGTVLKGLKHGLQTQLYVAVRSNGPASGAVYATLYVNGSPAYFQGSLVTGLAFVPNFGNWTWIAMNWSAPGAGTYTLSIVLTTENTDMFAQNNVQPLNYYNRPTTFT